MVAYLGEFQSLQLTLLISFSMLQLAALAYYMPFDTIKLNKISMLLITQCMGIYTCLSYLIDDDVIRRAGNDTSVSFHFVGVLMMMCIIFPAL